MSERTSKILFTAEGLLLLLPLALWTVFFLVVAYASYPLPRVSPLALSFDLAFVATLLALMAACYLVALHLQFGRGGVQQAPSIWMGLLAVGIAIGLCAAAIAVRLMLYPEKVPDFSGFALLSPAAVLAPIGVHLVRERRSLQERGSA